MCYLYNVLSLEDAVFFSPNFYLYLTKICGIFCFSRVSPSNLVKILEKIAHFSTSKKKNPWQIFPFFCVWLVFGLFVRQ